MPPHAEEPSVRSILPPAPTGLIRPSTPADLILPRSAPTLPTHYITSRESEEKLVSIDKNNWLPHRDGAPLIMFNTGRDANGERAAEIIFERPQDYRFRRPKETVEEHHLNRFVADWRRGLGNPLFTTYERGADPPDFDIKWDSHRAGLDVTHLVLEEQIAKHAAFREIKSALLQEGPRNFRHLRGLMVYVSLDEGAERHMRKMAPACIAALKSAKPEWDRHVSDPERGGAWEFFDEGAVTTGRLLRAPAGAFYGLMGFDIALTGGPVVRRREAWDRFQRLVTQHDKAGVDALLVPVTGPVAEGHVFFSDVVLAQLLSEQAVEEDATLEADHVRIIFLHTWLNRSIAAFYPRVKYFEWYYEGEDPFSQEERYFHYFSMGDDPGGENPQAASGSERT